MAGTSGTQGASTAPFCSSYWYQQTDHKEFFPDLQIVKCSKLLKIIEKLSIHDVIHDFSPDTVNFLFGLVTVFNLVVIL